MKAGLQAEAQAADFLVKQGYKIISRNWRTRQCEIDIIAKLADCIYFVEVKQRSTSKQGQGFQYVTPQKIRQMSFAAQLWVAKHHYNGEYQLAVVSVDGDEFTLFPVA